MGVVRLWLPCLGDVACHVIKAGTLRPDLHNQLWAGSSTVKCILYCYRERLSVRIREKENVFLHHIKLNWIWWSPSGLLVESCSGLAGLDQESWNSMDPDGLQEQSLDFIWTPDGVHQDAWLSVTTSNFGPAVMSALLQPIHRVRPFQLTAGNYTSLPIGTGNFKTLGVYIDMCSKFIWVTKVKAVGTAKTTLASLQCICLDYATPEAFMSDGGSHFKNGEVDAFCEENNIQHIT